MTQPLWEPDVLDRIGTLQLRARAAVTGYLYGAHASVRQTRNVEFADYKEYAPGDSLRDVDWRVAARSDRLVVRRHQAENEHCVQVLLDASGDMGTGGTVTGRSKWDYAVSLAASLIWCMERQRERVGLEVIGGQSVRWPYIGPGRGQANVARMFGVLAEAQPGGRANLAEAFVRTGERIRSRSLLIVIGDLMEEPDAWGPRLAALRARRVDVRVVQIVDDAEWALTLGAPALLRSPEGGVPQSEDFDDVRTAFIEERDGFCEEVESWMAATEARYVRSSTADPLPAVLHQLLRRG